MASQSSKSTDTSASTAAPAGTAATPTPTPAPTPAPGTGPGPAPAPAPVPTTGPAVPRDADLKQKEISNWEVLKSWRWEFLAAFLAVGILVCEILILVHYDKKLLYKHWSHTWSINSVFAFLTTILEASIMFYVGASMGQLRWHWYRKKQSTLDWLDIMSEASRPSGAMRLLFQRGMFRQLAAIGALIVIFLLGVNTFTQQVITKRNEPVSLGPGTGFIPVNTNYTWEDRSISLDLGTQLPLPDMVSAIQNGFYSFSNILEKSLSVEGWTLCEGEACDFGKYQSLGVCGRCEDNTVEVNNPCKFGNCSAGDYYTLKNELDISLSATNGLVNVTSDTISNFSPAFNGEVGPLIVRMNALVANQTETNRTGLGATAAQCAAWWCVKTYEGAIINGTLHERIIGIYTDTSASAQTTYRQENDITIRPPNCWLDNGHPTNSSYCTYTATAYAQVALQNFLAAPNDTLEFPPFLAGSTTFKGTGNSRTFNYTTLLAGGLTSLSSEDGIILEQLLAGFNSMVDQMSVVIRGSALANGGSQYTYGTAYSKFEKFHVRWGWIAYPIAIVVVSLIFFVVTIFMTRKDEAWKASVLPLLFHSFGASDRENFIKLDSVQEMKEESRGRLGFLRRDHRGHLIFHAGKKIQAHDLKEEIMASGTAGLLGNGAAAMSEVSY